MQYLYNDGELYYFMDEETYDQIPLTFDQVEDAMKYLRENDEPRSSSTWQCVPVEAPNFVDLKVIETEPGVKDDTATNVTKAATVETGAVIQVPIFIEEGEIPSRSIREQANISEDPNKEEFCKRASSSPLLKNDAKHHRKRY